VKVGACDTGISEEHSVGRGGDLNGAVFASRDFTGSRQGVLDIHGHGTHVAGIIGARAGNDRGIAGVAPKCQLAIAKVLGDNGFGSDDSVAAGIVWCVEQGCQVINLSLGGGGRSRKIEDAITYANTKGCIVVCAAGNEGGRVGWPAAAPNNLCIGAIDANKVLANFSNRGNEVDYVGPGVEILSTYARGGYAKLSGTSMATPWISGLIANMLSHRSGPSVASAATYREIFDRAVIDLGPPGHDPGYGHGVPDPRKLFAAIAPEPVHVPEEPTDRPTLGKRFRIQGEVEILE
jgi:subtilisin family serine protease